jgi:hypothetical protein
MKTNFFIVFFLFSISIGLFSQDDSKFNCKIKLAMLGSDSTGGKISIIKNGTPYQMIESDGIDYFLELDLNADYLIECSKRKYLTKVVFIDTHVPDGREEKEFAPFSIRVELIKKKRCVKEDKTKLVGGVCYDPIKEDFDKCKTTLKN